jgi:PAS domain S-box-containing protein
VLKYSIAVLTVAAALIVRLAAWNLLGTETPFTFFYAALAVSAWFGGFGPGVAATLLSAGSVAYFLLPPHREFRLEHVHILHLAIFVCTGVLSSWLMGRLIAATRQARQAQEEAKRHAAEAQEGKRLMDALLEYIPESIVIVDAPDGAIRAVSRFAGTSMGRKPEELLGIPIQQFVSGPERIGDVEANPAGMPGEEALTRVLRDGATITEKEWIIRHPDGRTDWLLSNAGPIRDESGTIVRAIIAWHEITVRKRMEEELRQARIGLETRVAERTAEVEHERNKLLSILTTMCDIVYIVNRDYEIEFANPAFEKDFGAPARGQRCYEHTHNRSEACPWCRNQEVFAGHSLSWEWTSPADGKAYDVLDAPLLNKDGSISKLKILHDITGLKRAEEALSQSREDLQRLSSELLTAQETERMRISHELHDELGQALTLIKLRIGLIEMTLPPDEQTIRDHCRNADTYVDQVIEDVRRLSRDLCPSSLENLGITAALHRLVSDSMKATGIQIKAELEEVDDLLGSQPRLLLYRVFQEMLNNTIKHSGATEVRISGKRKDGHIHFDLQDNGRGMDTEEAESGRVGPGRGLGLAIMRERVRTLGGLLEVRSRKGAGTRLSFTIPVNPPEGARQ